MLSFSFISSNDKVSAAGQIYLTGRNENLFKSYYVAACTLLHQFFTGSYASIQNNLPGQLMEANKHSP